VNAEDIRIFQEEVKRAKEWPCELPFNISHNPGFTTISNLLDFVGEGKFTICGYVDGVARQQGYHEPCMLRFPYSYTGKQSWDDLRADLNKSAEKQGFQVTVRNTANSAQATAWTISCTRNRIFDDKACKREYEDGGAQFAAGMEVTMVKENRRVEQCEPTGVHQPRKMEIDAQHGRKINVHSKSTPLEYEI
jgi:hypothetical protein